MKLGKESPVASFFELVLTVAPGRTGTLRFDVLCVQRRYSAHQGREECWSFCQLQPGWLFSSDLAH